ncbi:site-specific integrase [Pseudoalteromonas ulvae]|uniref:Integrase n=1 Tax=Pseudoalteromonas ulvae TaxID=107327 RepID=A0A244CUD1_PSEDV|nr:site-specific integrase [Pseudoalteromonas ulvae]OUL59223.1 hypothetical protein B1199_02860 [Pseudoalteromonas ulvae]
MGEKTRKKLPRGVRIKTHRSGASTLIITFTYQGIKCPEPLSNRLVDDSNIKYAERLRAEILNKIENNTFVYADYFPNSSKLELFGAKKTTDTLSKYLDKYINHAERRGVKPSTLVTYESRKRQISGWVGKLKPAAITLASIRDVAIAMDKDGHSYTTIRNCFKVLKGALDEAAMDGAIPTNPIIGFPLANYVSKPKRTIDDDDTSIDPFNKAELNALLNACRTDQEKLMLQIWCKTGLRTGEICALKWENVNIKRGYIKIRENYVSMVALTGTTKTAAGSREIDLDDETIELFEKQRLITAIKGEFVFQNDRAVSKMQFDSYSIRRWFVRLCDDAAVRYRYAYHLRHTFATIQISQGTNLWQLAETLGHSSPQMLYNHYGSFIKDYAGKDSIFSKKAVQK